MNLAYTSESVARVSHRGKRNSDALTGVEEFGGRGFHKEDFWISSTDESGGLYPCFFDRVSISKHHANTRVR